MRTFNQIPPQVLAFQVLLDGNTGWTQVPNDAFNYVKNISFGTITDDQGVRQAYTITKNDDTQVYVGNGDWLVVHPEDGSVEAMNNGAFRGKYNLPPLTDTF